MVENPLEKRNKKHKRRLLLILAITFVSICILCTLIPLYQYLRYGKLSIPIGAADCGWNGTGLAWIDSNSNGIFDKDESPLPGVTFHVNDVLNHFQDVNGPSISNWKGEAELGVWLPGCPGTSFEIYPDVPQGFRLTTGAKLSIDGGFQNRQFAFGFSQIAGFPTVTPRPLPPVCVSYSLGTYINALAVSSDGSVWVSVYGKGVSRFISEQKRWISYTKKDGLGSDNVRAITAGDNGVMWFGTVDGISKYEDGKWQSFTTVNGIPLVNVYFIKPAKDESVWFATLDDTLYHYQPEANRWETYSKDIMKQYSIMGLAVTNDNTAWVLTVGELIQIPPTQNRKDIKVYEESDIGGKSTGYITDFQVGPDGLLWFAGSDQFFGWDFLKDIMTEIKYSSPYGGFDGLVSSFRIAPNGSFWVARQSDHPVIYNYNPPSSSLPESWRVFDERDGISISDDPISHNYGVIALDIASNNDIWIATRQAATECKFEP